MLNEQQINLNWTRLQKLVSENFSDRYSGLKKLYEENEMRIATCPASSNPDYHNAFTGGYVDHILRVYDNSIALYDQWKTMNMDLSGFSLDELKFVAIHHDLGKMGFPGTGNEYYFPNDNAWEIKNRNRIYKVNTEITWMTLADMTLYLLQEYGVRVSLNEWHAIRVHDGPYEKTNESYYMNFFSNGKFKTNLPYLIHYADLMAMRFEYQRYVNSKDTNSSTITNKSEKKELPADFMKAFNNLK